MRKGELLALEWSDIDFDADTISITKAVSVVNGKQITKAPKTHGERYLFSISSLSVSGNCGSKKFRSGRQMVAIWSLERICYKMEKPQNHCGSRVFRGASDLTRTGDLLITSEMHYRLCYTSIHFTRILYRLPGEKSTVFCPIIYAPRPAGSSPAATADLQRSPAACSHPAAGPRDDRLPSSTRRFSVPMSHAAS